MLDFDYVEWDEQDDPQGNVPHITDSDVTMEEGEDVLYSIDNEPDS